MKEKSFTLIELLVVIAIIGLLSSIVLVSMGGVQSKAKITKILEFSQSVQHTLGAYAVGWWSFESIEAGKVIDGSGYNNHGTVNGATLVAGLEQLGNALSFDGSNDYVQIPHTTSLNLGGTNPFSVETWLKLNVVATGGIVSKRPPGYAGSLVPFQLIIASSRIKFQSRYGVGWTSDTDTANAVTGKWYHIVGVYDGDKTYLYVDGIQKSSSDPTQALDTNTENVTIGGDSYGYINGTIDEVRIYEKALTLGEIQKHYVEGLERHRDLAIK